jgi:hypothetical protein
VDWVCGGSLLSRLLGDGRCDFAAESPIIASKSASARTAWSDFSIL